MSVMESAGAGGVPQAGRLEAGPSENGRAETGRNRFYLAAWRWHFYAGLYVIPFLLVLATTGLVMLWSAVLVGRDGERVHVVPGAATAPVSVQAAAALAAHPGGTLVQYVVPREPDLAAVFHVDAGGQAFMVAVDPFSGRVVAEAGWRQGLYDLANKIHGTLLIGTVGDRLLEIAAGLGMILVITGLYLWWPRDGGLGAALVPDLRRRGRPLWKSLHQTTGVWISVLLVLFLLSGLSWTGIWGERIVQAWSTFPAEKWDNVPLSDAVHAAMNHRAGQDVPWGLEQTAMPESGSAAGTPGIPDGVAVDIDAVVALARGLGFPQRFRLDAPEGPQGVWTISHDSMSNDGPDPTADRTVHVDQYSGRVLADVGFADYSLGAKAMAVGIAFHEGDLGGWSVALNTALCLAVIFVAVSGLVMWCKRRPAGAGRLAAPPLPADLPMWRGAVAIGIALSLAFPLTGLALVAVMAVDLLLVSRVPALRRAVS